MQDFTEKELLYKEEIRQLRSDLKSSLLEKAKLQQQYELSLQLPSLSITTPPFLLDSSKDTLTDPVPILFLSDWHWGEVVNSAEINYSNHYNLAVAHERAEYCFQEFLHFYKRILRISSKGMVLLLGGDMVSGEIHEELSETNEIHTLEAVTDCAGVITEGIRLLQQCFEEIVVFGVSGNHGRFYQHKRHKKRNSSNFDAMIYSVCQMQFKDDPRVRFCLPKTADCYFEIYENRYMLTHGDLLGGSMSDPIIGALGAISRGDQKLRKRQESLGVPYDVLVCGHWHQYSLHPRRIINGSLKGYDEFAYQHSFYPERPIQATWLVEEGMGITVTHPIFCD